MVTLWVIYWYTFITPLYQSILLYLPTSHTISIHLLSSRPASSSFSSFSSFSSSSPHFSPPLPSLHFPHLPSPFDCFLSHYTCFAFKRFKFILFQVLYSSRTTMVSTENSSSYIWNTTKVNLRRGKIRLRTIVSSEVQVYFL